GLDPDTQRVRGVGARRLVLVGGDVDVSAAIDDQTASAGLGGRAVDVDVTLPRADRYLVARDRGAEAVGGRVGVGRRLRLDAEPCADARVCLIYIGFGVEAARGRAGRICVRQIQRPDVDVA